MVEETSGRMYRLFRRGHREEETIVADLKLAGVQVIHTGDADQLEVSEGMLKGHLDGIILGGVPEAPKSKMVLEMKSYNDKRFQTLEKDGVEKSDPKYYCQCQVYMLLSNLDRCLFVCVNKNDDSMHVERLKLDKSYARTMIDRAKGFALEPHMPPALSDKPDWWQCRFCAAYDLCHGSRTLSPLRVTCRTCANVTPKEDGSWFCEKCQQNIPFEAQMRAWPCHVIHPDLVPWKLDEDNSADWVACFVMPDGTITYNGEGHDPSVALLSQPGEAVASC
jgi:hypothetical protein